MKLTTLLEHHRRHVGTANALRDSFGDGYLVSQNKIYSRVRAESLKAGFAYSAAPNAAYSALALSQLESIMQAKVIPYSANVAVVEDLETKIPRLTDWDDIVDNFKGTHVFHEACHGVARTFAPELSHERSEDSRVLAMLLEESFANTCELLSIIDAEDQVHRLFLELNSYVYMLDDRAGLRAAAAEVGRPALISFLILAYLHANFLRPLTDKDFERCCAIASAGRALDAKQKKMLRAISKIAFKLNPRFREVTTRFHLKLHGIKSEVASFGRFDFLGALEKSRSAQAFLKSASLF